MRFDCHNHTHYSNLRLVDAINTPKKLVDRAIELGLCGIAITEHECLSGSIKINKLQDKIRSEYPDFKIAIGNEIYLTEDRRQGQKYFHFILIAKDAVGHKMLRELSSTAWINSYYDRGMERVPTLYSEVRQVVERYGRGHLIATSACLGGYLSSNTLDLIVAENVENKKGAETAHQNIVNFMLWCDEVFGEDFYVECAPSLFKEQIAVNERLYKIAKAFNKKMVVGSDAHYLKKEDRYIHKAYLQSKDGEREVDGFYDYAYLASDDEVKNVMEICNIPYEWIEQNSIEIYEKIENYSLLHNQSVVEVPVKDYPKRDFDKEYPTLNYLAQSDNIQERYWFNQCIDKLEEKELFNKEYLDRLEEEARVKGVIGKELETCIYAYPITLQHYINMFWENGSTVGAGRGSSCSGLNHWLLGVTQLNPIRWGFPFWRYLNDARTELPDIDIDIATSKRPIIIRKIKEEREQFLKEGLQDFFRKELGLTLIATFGTETSKSAIITACRGYRSEDYPDGIDNDVAQYLSSLVPVERGFVWPIEDMIYGNLDKDRKPVNMFVQEIKQYPGLLDIILGIQGLINKRSSHASGVILYGDDPFDTSCFMKTPKGEVITQYDLHDEESAGSVKFDFLVTEIQDKIVVAIDLLQEKGLLPKEKTLKEIYDEYLHPEVINEKDPEIWEAICSGKILDLFQFDSPVGGQAIKLIQPANIQTLSDSNGLMRLMTSEEGQDSPMLKYSKFKKNIGLWYAEMDRYGLTKDEVEYVRPYFEPSYGVPPSQEQMMMMAMDKNICNFSLAEANDLRKVVGKKIMSRVPEMHEKILTKCSSPNLARYIWEQGVGTQMGYSFSLIHAMAYAFIAYQVALLSVKFSPIVWNTACLIVNSGSLETEDENVKDKSTDYGKIAKAIGNIMSRDIEVSPVDINHSEFSFYPDIENNEILFGLKGVNKIGDDFAKSVIDDREYNSLIDFLNKVNPKKDAMIQLIKSGAFDRLENCSRKVIMGKYLWLICNKKPKLNLQNLNGLIKENLIPQSLNFQLRVYNFNQYLKARCKKGDKYVLDVRALDFMNENYSDSNIIVQDFETKSFIMSPKDWDKIYQKEMDKVREWLKNNQSEVLDKYNKIMFKNEWEKYAEGSISAWEMESLCFYYHDHELKNIDYIKYGLSDYSKLSETPVVEKTFRRNKVDIPIFKTFKIIGTVLDKDKTKHIATILTPEGNVVNVKFNKEYFAMFDKQISERQADGSKKIMERSWFKRGNMIMVTGFRRDDQFVAKSYKSTSTHQLYRLTKVKNKGVDMELTHDRYKGEEEEDNE